MAQDLLGKIITTDINNQLVSGRIVETEAYRADDDKGSHAYPNKITKRTARQFGPGGVSYIYLCYGIHHLFNVITGPAEVAHVILVRAVEILEGVDIARSRRKIKGPSTQLANGPGKWTQAFGITTAHDACLLTEVDSVISIHEGGVQYAPDQIISGPRVGIAYAQECAVWPWRFRVKGNTWTSKPDTVSYPL